MPPGESCPGQHHKLTRCCRAPRVLTVGRRPGAMRPSPIGADILNIPINIVLLKTTFPLGKAPWGKLPRGTFFWFPRGTVRNGLILGERSPGEFFDTSSPGERVFFSPGERCFFQGNVAFSGDFPLGESAFPRGILFP